MKRQYDLQIPKKDFSKTNRLISKEGISYFSKSEPSILVNDMIDSVDISLRILCHFCMQTPYKIKSFYSGYFYERDELKNLWNIIKKEEKVIRGSGLDLTKFDGSKVVFQDSSYRTYWPSFEGFASDYNSKEGWLEFDVASTLKDQISLLKDLKNSLGKYTTMNNSVNSIEYDTFTFKVSPRESHLAAAEWRRLTEVLITSFIESKKVVV